MLKHFLILLLVSITLSANSQVSYQQLRSNMLQNIWTDADYELYLKADSKFKTERPFYTEPAYYSPISANTLKLIANATVFCPNANSVYLNGKKQFIDSANRLITPKTVNGKLQLPESIAYQLLGTKNTKGISKNKWIDIELLAKGLGKITYTNSLGLLIISSKPQPELANINRDTQYEILYNTLYERPVGATVIADVVKHTSNKHPYILLNQKRFDEIKSLIETDEFAKKCFAKTLSAANKMLSEPLDEYTYSEAEGIFATIRSSVASKVLNLGMAYYLTGESKYADRAVKEMLNVASWADWGCSQERQFLGTGGVARGMGLGYDWFYNYMSAEQRTTIQQAIVSKAIHPGLFYHTVRHANRFVLAKNNWNAVSNGGLIVSALAIAADESELAGRLLQFSLGSLENVLSIYAPNGDYEEGPLYWAYGTGSLVHAMAAIESATGRTYGISDAPGIDKTAYFTPYMIGPTGFFNFHDSKENNEKFVTEPEYLWFAKRFNNPDFYWERLYLPEQQKGTATDLIWYTGKAKGAFNLKLDYMGAGENNAVGTGTFRSSWTDPNALFLGFHAGYSMANHSQADEGSFIFDAMGERWIMDVGDGRMDLSPEGKTLVNASKYFGKERPLFYRIRTEGQNCYVINPNESLGQDFSKNNRPQFEKLSMHQPDKAFAIADISCAYKGQVESAKRGFMLDRKNKFALIQDEVTCCKPSTIYSFIHTRANIQLIENEKAAIFSIGNKRMYVKLIGNTENAKLTVMEAKGLLPTAINMKQMDDVRKLAIKFDNVTTMNIAIVCIPMNEIDSKPNVNTEFSKLLDWK